MSNEDKKIFATRIFKYIKLLKQVDRALKKDPTYSSIKPIFSNTAALATHFYTGKDWGCFYLSNNKLFPGTMVGVLLEKLGFYPKAAEHGNLSAFDQYLYHNIDSKEIRDLISTYEYGRLNSLVFSGHMWLNNNTQSYRKNLMDKTIPECRQLACKFKFG